MRWLAAEIGLSGEYCTRARAIFGLIIVLGAGAARAENEEPTYLEYVRKSNPIAHYRLSGTEPGSLVNLVATGEVRATMGRTAGASNVIAVVQGPSPREFIGKDRINGFEEENACLRFRHSDDSSNAVVVIPGSSVPDLSAPHEDAFTLSVWVKAAKEQPNRASIVIRKAGDELDSYQFALAVWENRYDIIMHYADGKFRSMFSPSTPDGEWQHLVVVLDNKDRFENSAGCVKLFVNGVRTFTAATKNHTRTQMMPSDRDLHIGGMAYEQTKDKGFNRGFIGCIDEVTLWDRPLSDAEVSDLFKAAIIGRKPMVIIVGQL